jgi:hypothetical protein
VPTDRQYTIAFLYQRSLIMASAPVTVINRPGRNRFPGDASACPRGSEHLADARV